MTTINTTATTNNTTNINLYSPVDIIAGSTYIDKVIEEIKHIWTINRYVSPKEVCNICNIIYFNGMCYEKGDHPHKELWTKREIVNYFITPAMDDNNKLVVKDLSLREKIDNSIVIGLIDNETFEDPSYDIRFETGVLFEFKNQIYKIKYVNAALEEDIDIDIDNISDEPDTTITNNAYFLTKVGKIYLNDKEILSSEFIKKYMKK